MANVSSNNLTTLYSGSGASIRPTASYGNSNVVALLNAGTDGGNTVTNILANGNVIANGYGDFGSGLLTGGTLNVYGNAIIGGNVSALNITASDTLTTSDLLVNSTNVHIGQFAGNGVQGNYSVAVGYAAGGANQGNLSVAYGYSAGSVNQGANSVAIGPLAGEFSQGDYSIAIGANAGYTLQASNSIILNASGSNLDQTTANTFTVKPVRNANTANVMYYNNTTGEITYDLASNVVANNANYANYAGNAFSVNVANVVGIGNIAVINLDGNVSNILHGNGYWGPEAGNLNANYANYAGNLINGTSNVSIPSTNGNVVVGINGTSNVLVLSSSTIVANTITNVRIGPNAGITSQGANSIAIGNEASANQGTDAINIGRLGPSVQGNRGISIGWTGTDAQGNDAIAIGTFAGTSGGSGSTQGEFGIAMGRQAGAFKQGNRSISIGYVAGRINQSANSIAIGYEAAAGGQGIDAVSIGSQAGTATQGNYSIALGYYAGASSQGINSISIGANAGRTGQGNNTIILNATGSNLDQTTANTFTVKPVRNANTSNVMFYNNTTGEITYDLASNVVTANSNYANFAGTAYSVSGSNVSGEVAYAAVANSVALANVSGAGNIASLNLDGNASNILYGNGVFSAVPNTATANFANYAGNVTVSAQGNITSLGNLVSLTINNGNVVLPTKQFNPNGITVGTTANTNLMANSSFVDIDYGNGQGDGNLILGKTTTYVKARGNATTIATAAANDRIGRTNYMVYNGTSNVLAVSTHAIPTALNSNANAVTTGGQYLIFTGNPNGDQGNANASSSLNTYAFGPGGTIAVQAGAATGSGSYASFGGYGITVGGNGVQSQGMNFVRYRGNRDSNLSVQAGDQLGSFGFLGYNGSAIYSARTASLQAVVDSAYVTNATVITSGFKLTSVNTSNQNDFWFYSNGNARLGLIGGGNSTFQTNATVFVNNFDSAGNVANIAGNLNVGTGANLITLDSPNGYFTYNRTFGDFYNSSTITPGAANTPAVLALGTAGTANNCSIQSTSQLLISRVGNYNLQFSLQAVNADNAAEHDFWVWLRKNGSDVTNSATDYTVIKNNGKTVAMLSFNVSSNGSDYFEIAYAVADTQITFPAYAANSQGFTHPAIPSLIVNLIPIGA